MSRKMLMMVALLASVCVNADDEEITMEGGQTRNNGFFAVPAPKKVVVDASLDEWDFSGEIQTFNDYEARDQYSVKTAAMWDKENLYLSFYWKDTMPLNSTVDPDLEPEIGWLADAVQLRVVADGQTSWVTCWEYNGNANVGFVFWEETLKLGKSKNILLKGKDGKAAIGEGVESAYKLLPEKDGFIHEMKIPWKLLFQKDVAVNAGDKVKMQLEFKWGEITGHLWPLLQVTDNGGVAMNWMDPSGWKYLTLSKEPLDKKRTYVYNAWKPEGTIPVRVKIPADAQSFTVVIEDENGNRIRNLAGGFNPDNFRVGEIKNGEQTVEVMWDGMDDSKQLAKPGTYKLRGLTHHGLSSKYVMSFYNPGTPSWETPDGLGAWGADHSRVKFAARSGENVILSTGFSEGGYGLFAIGPDGKKIWSEKRGVVMMSANEKYVFAVPTHWQTTTDMLSRYDAKKGGFAAFKLENGELKPELELVKIVGRELKQYYSNQSREGFNKRDEVADNPRVLAMACGPKSVLLALCDGAVVEVDQETGVKLAEYQLDFDETVMKGAETHITGEPVDRIVAPLAYDGETIFFYRKGVLTTFNVKTKAFATIATSEKVEAPVSIAIGEDKSLYIADRGADNQVKRFDLNGKLISKYGKKGGRPHVGKFDPEGMREVSSVAVDARGIVWTVEFTDYPRRVSCWGKDGKLAKEYVGNTGYSGTGAFLHDNNPGRAFLGAVELNLDEEKRSYSVENIVVNPLPNERAFALGTGSHEAGHVFYSSASGERHEYYYRAGTLFLFDEKTKSWRAVSAVRNVGKLQNLFHNASMTLIKQHPYGDFEGMNPYDVVIWNDLNGDGQFERAECEVLIKSDIKYELMKNVAWFLFPRPSSGWGSRMDPADLSFYLTNRTGNKEKKIGDRYKLVPSSFGADGAPKYTVEKTKVIGQMPPIESLDMYPVPNEDTLIIFSRKGKNQFIIGYDKEMKNEKWSYPDPYDNVHGSHGAIMPRPGVLIGPLKVTGVVPKCGEAEGVFMMRGNLGSDFYMTTDGLYIGSMFKDCRLPRPNFPADEETLCQMPFQSFSMNGEPFNGWIGRRDDGSVRMVCGMHEAAMICTIDGLDTIKRFNGGNLKVSDHELVKANADYIARSVAPATGAPYKIRAVNEDVIAWNKIPAMNISIDGLLTKATCRLAYNDQKLFAHFEVNNDETPWLNKGKDLTRMFKTGDCVDLQLSPSGNRGGVAKEGDLRLVASPNGDGNVVMMMRKVFAKAKEGEKVRYQSPVRAFEMDQVKKWSDPKVAVKGKSYTVDFDVTWEELGVKPSKGLKMRGDAGIILSDPVGLANSARVYYANKSTNLVNDLPSEADLYPNMWADFILE